MIKMISLWGVRAAVLGAAATLHAQPTYEIETVPLLEAVQDVLKTSPGLRAEEERLRAAEQAVASARAAGLPNVSLAASSTVNDQSFDPGPEGEELFEGLFGGGDPGDDVGGGGIAIANDGIIEQNQASLSVTQPLFTGLRIKNSIEEAKFSVKAAQAQYEGVRQDFAVRVAEAHLTVFTAEEQMKSVEKSFESVSNAAKAAQISFEEGQGTKTDVALADAQLALTNARLAQSLSDNVSARNAYVALAGRPPALVNFDEAVLPVPDDPEAVVAAAVEKSPQVRAAVFLADARTAGERAARGQRSPTLQLRGALSYAENNIFEGDTTENATLTAELSMPLFQGGAIGADIRRAAADARASRFSLAEARANAEANARTVFARYQAAVIAREAATARLNASELAFRGVVLERDVGQRSILDVLQVEADLLDARVAELEARRNLILASYRVRFIMGDLLSAPGR
ncbi:MAG: TolC family protein [Pseudomonadota bacterium]